MKVPRKISNVISSVLKHKKIPAFIYNLPEDVKQNIIDSQKNIVFVDAFEVQTHYHVLNAVAKSVGLTPGSVRYDSPLIVKIEQKIGSKILVIDRAEYLALKTYSQIKEFMKMNVPVLVLSSYPGFIDRFRETKFYRENVIIEFDYNDIK